MNFYQAIIRYLSAGIDTRDNLPLKRNSRFAVSRCTLILLREVTVITWICLGFVTLDQLSKVRVSTVGAADCLEQLFASKGQKT